MLNILKLCLGKNNGLGRKLSEYVERDIIEHHCLAHRLHLAIHRAFTISEKYDRDNPPLKFMNHLEILLNKLYRQVLAHIRMVNGLLVFVRNLQASLFLTKPYKPLTILL